VYVLIKLLRTKDLGDASDGTHAKEGLGTIAVKIYRVKVTGPWEGKLTSQKPADVRPILIDEKSGDVDSEHRVAYVAIFDHSQITLDLGHLQQ
jgi:hypothetical protein